MEKVESNVVKKIEKEKHQIYKLFLQDKITLEELKKKLSLIYETEELIEERPIPKILLDKREVRELAGKTLYISLPKEIINYGWKKGAEVKISIDKKGKKIILEKL